MAEDEENWLVVPPDMADFLVQQGGPRTERLPRLPVREWLNLKRSLLESELRQVNERLAELEESLG